MSTPILDENLRREIRARAVHYVSYEVAMDAGFLCLANLERYVNGKGFDPNDTQLAALAKRMGFRVPYSQGSAA